MNGYLQPVRQFQVVARDGTRLAAYESGLANGPALVLCNGLGGNFGTWRPLAEHFASAWRIVSWDYRGLFGSGAPHDPEAYGIDRHCDDLEDVLAFAGVDSAVFVGWSMGVQVAFEFYRRRPEAFRALVQINGTHGRPFETAFRSGWMRSVAPSMLAAMAHASPLFATLGPLVVATRYPLALAKIVGLASPTLDESVFLQLAREYVRLDFGAYSRIFRALGDHDTRDVLPTIAVPTLLITGEHDLFTPVELSQRMADEIPGAELMVVRGGTHYTPIEYPMVVNLRIAKFLRERLGTPRPEPPLRKTPDAPGTPAAPRKAKRKVTTTPRRRSAPPAARA